MIRLQKFIYFIFAFFLGVFIIGSMFWKADLEILLNVEVPIKEVPVFVRQNLLFLILSAVLFFILYRALFGICCRLEKFKPSYIVPIVLGCSVIFQVVIMVQLPVISFGDADFIYSYFAKDFLNGNYTALQPGQYLHYYPHNLGMTLYDMLLLKIFPQSLFVPKIINIMFTTLSSFIIYRLYKEFDTDNTKRPYGVLVFSCFFLPPVFLNNLIYNDIISSSLFLYGIYFSVLYMKRKGFSFALASALCFGVGSFMRPLGIIFVIAVILVMLFKSLGVKRILIFALMCGLLLKFPLWITSFYFEQKGIIKEPLGKNAAPVLKWIHMGISEERFGYWDDNQSLYMYLTDAKGDKKESEKLFMKGIQDKIRKMGPVNLIKMYFKKAVWQWTQGTFSSDDSILFDKELISIVKKENNMDVFQYDTVTSKYLAENKKARDAITWSMYITQFLMFCLILYYLVVSIKRKDYTGLLFVFIILGFIGFYLLWEIKPRYVFPCYPYLILLSFQGMKKLSFISIKKFKKQNAVEV
ncbi:MAG: hypothetical protein N2645_06545 [Clostridia bacterium]|nr:hypothetical protein [Clostridia bacterium]